MPNPFELQNLRQRLKSLAEVCPQNGSMQTRQQLVAAAFGLSSDLSFLSQLFDVCVEACKDFKGCQGAAQTCIMGAAAALLYLPGRGLKVLQQFLACVFMPMLTSSRLPSQVYPQIASSLCSLLASEAGWAQLSGLLHICRQGLQKAGSVGSDASDAGGKKPGDMLCMPLHTCCCLAPSILEACCQSTPESTPTALESTHAESEAQTVAPKDEAGLDFHAQELLSSALEMLLPQVCRRQA
ncbi:hypothetical protein DUNSADRAFT_2723 [Dunaliella salina]|uniref:Uncharacterized protein n=1 Tax=Dunaliella salina TaxID=3046 RepID=A0ABQ7GVC3_DUNSA|nr:hypothetical protein DUNSADRAFT_2723 [Dunaliella salina]|eukprot:KAF5838525.1 hypothetical protein DUNSADRAFT_2723 [Dunaliella salina]